jgi:hypothetical protein
MGAIETYLDCLIFFGPMSSSAGIDARPKEVKKLSEARCWQRGRMCW